MARDNKRRDEDITATQEVITPSQPVSSSSDASKRRFKIWGGSILGLAALVAVIVVPIMLFTGGGTKKTNSETLYEIFNGSNSFVYTSTKDSSEYVKEYSATSTENVDLYMETLSDNTIYFNYIDNDGNGSYTVDVDDTIKMVWIDYIPALPDDVTGVWTEVPYDKVINVNVEAGSGAPSPQTGEIKNYTNVEYELMKESIYQFWDETADGMRALVESGAVTETDEINQVISFYDDYRPEITGAIA